MYIDECYLSSSAEKGVIYCAQLILIRAFSDVETPFLFSDLAALTLKPPNQKIKKAFRRQRSLIKIM